MFSPEKLFEIMKKKGFNNQKLANALNDIGISIKADAFKAYKSHRASPRMEVFSGIVDVLDIEEQDLFERTSRKSHINIQKSTLIFGNKELKENVVKIPIFEQGTFLSDIKNLVSDKNLYIEMNILKNYYNYKNIIAINVFYDSTERKNIENNIFLIEFVKNKEFSKVDGLYLVRYDNIMQIKRVQFLGNDEVLLISLDIEYPPINPKEVVGNNWEILGKVFIKMGIEYYTNIEYLR